MSRIDSFRPCCRLNTESQMNGTRLRASLTIYNAAKANFPDQGSSMSRLHRAAAALVVLTLATAGCARNRNLPTQLAPSKISTIGVNSYLWRASVDTVSFAPLLQADSNSGVIITDWYS